MPSFGEMRMLSGVAVGAGVGVNGIEVAVSVGGIGVGEEIAAASRVAVGAGWQAARNRMRRGSIFLIINTNFQLGNLLN